MWHYRAGPFSATLDSAMLGPVLECGEVQGRPLRLVPTTERHLDACVRWLTDREVTRLLGLRFPVSAEQEGAWYRNAVEDRNRVFWSVEWGERHVGQTGIESINWIARTAVTGILIGEKDCWGQGIAGAVMRRRSAYAFDELNLVALFTEIFLQNEASLRAAVRAGYREYGRRPYSQYMDGEYFTSWLGVLSRDDFRKQP